MGKRLDPKKLTAQFMNERNKALVSLDEKRIKKMFRRWGVPYPSDDVVFWGSVHKAITDIYISGGRYVTEEHYKASKIWLEERGMSAGVLGK